ncbi:MAG: transketolase [Thermoproteota archaeon]|nr:transketolase [Thermoproteota archaeon]
MKVKSIMSYESFLENKANRIRLHVLHATTKAGSGHPTTCFSAAEIVSTLFFKEMNFDPENMDYFDNDEFILSKGHAAPILYAVLMELGVLEAGSIMKLRQSSSKLEGHPVPRIKGVRVTTGSLGQGLAIGIGMVYAKRLLNINRRIFVLIGDGEMAEGSVWEAINFAGRFQIPNIVAILDMNRLGQSGPTMYEWNSEEYKQRIMSFGWNVFTCDGHNLGELIDVFEKAKTSKGPSFIIAKTVKGKGAIFLENAEGWHGRVLNNKEALKVEKELLSRIGNVMVKPTNWILAKNKLEKTVLKLAVKTDYRLGDLVATREAYGKSLEKLGEIDSKMVVLDSDVKNSTFTELFFKKYPGRSIESYIAEQDMVGIGLGLQTHGLNVFFSTFACFLSRAFDQLRMAAYSRANLKVAGSHAGISIGEDGPSQMGLEDVSMFRSIFGSTVLYPCDAVSSEKLTCLTASHKGISYLRTTRQKTPVIYGNEEEFRIGGSKVLRWSGSDVTTVLAAGITVHETLKAYQILRRKGMSIRVVDCYSIKPMDEQSIRLAAEETGELVTV